MPNDLHVMPVNDLRDHEESRDCWCHPEIVHPDALQAIVIHSSMDQRELYERGERKPH